MLGKYTRPGSNGRIDYRAFCQDLGKGGGNQRPAVALTQGQEDMLRRAKEFLKDANGRLQRGEQEPQAKLMAAFKRKDHGNKGYLTIPEVEDCLRAAGVGHMFADPRDRGDRNYGDQWCRCIEANSQNKYPYKELMELICGKEAGELFSADVQALETGTWSLSGKAPAKFVPPLDVRNARTAYLGNLGEKMLATRENYEEKLKQAAGRQPGLDLARLLAVLQND